MRALIVDDDEVVQGILKAYLTHHAEEHGKTLEVLQLLDARRALDLLIKQKDSFDVVFLDVHLPELSSDNTEISVNRP